jgi:hypothetical protein
MCDWNTVDYIESMQLVAGDNKFCHKLVRAFGIAFNDVEEFKAQNR